MYLLAAVSPDADPTLIPILIAIGLGIAVLAFLLMRRKGAGKIESGPDKPGDKIAPAKVAIPASKEVFAPLPEAKTSEPAVDLGPKAEAAAEPAEAAEVTPAAPTVVAEAAEAGDAAAPAAPAEPLVAATPPDPQAHDAAEREVAEAEAKASAERAAADLAAKAAAKKAAADAAAKKAAADAAAKKAAAKRAAEEAPRSLKEGLGRTRKEGFIARLGGVFKGKAIDDDLIEEIEEILFTADIGARTADRLLDSVKEALSRKELKNADKVWEVLRAEANVILAAAADKDGATTPAAGQPRVIMVLGVNGVGKTTSIGKMAHQHVAAGKKVALIAGDTFRAAAAEQLEHWGRRVGAEVYRGAEGADPASVVFDGVRKALAASADIVFVDTAGRLHTQKNLMEELRKVRRVMGKAIEGAPHEVLMVLDATTGQNAISQATQFKEATEVTSIVLTKLDGTAKGGVVLGVCDTLAIPIKYVGIGERVADLMDFNASDFVDALFSPPS